MTQFKRLIAFLLCLLMIFPTQELTILAETMSMDHVQAEEIISAEPIENGTDLIEETQQSEPTEDGEDRIKETLPLEPIEDETDRIKETLPLEPIEDETDRIKETLPLEPMEDETDRVKETLPLEPMEDETDRIKETLPLEPIDGGNSGVDRINKTLSLEPLADDTYAIYWNPGGQLPAELATSSDATATASDASSTKARKGKDSASGLSPSRPVKTLEKAVERAKKLMENKGLDSSDITIYAMNPMEVADGELYVLNAGNMRIASWPERPYQSDALFYVNGGQLTLMNVLLEAEDPAYEPDETELIYVRGGSLQMGQNVNINGCVIMDYNSELEDIKWKEDIATPSNTVEAGDRAAEKSEQMTEVLPFQMLFSKDSKDLKDSMASRDSKTSTASKASATRKASTASQAGKASFNIDNYWLDTSEENIELLKDRISASTWREPIIELMEGFDGGSEYLLKVRDDGRAESRELVTTLYADDATAEEFLGYFTLAESDDWSLQVETAAAAKLKDTGSGVENAPQAFTFGEAALTSKTLIASRSLGNTKVIYWNPVKPDPGAIYPAGDDELYDGSTPFAPLKTWEAAAKEAKRLNGVVVAMQSLDLGAQDAGEYLPQLPGGEFYLASVETSLITSLGTWNATAQPAIIVPKNKTLIIEDLYLGGKFDGSGNETEAQSILVDEGDLVIEKNVRTEEKGYIQLNAFRNLKDHPIKVCSVDSSEDGGLRIFFGGINNNIEYRYVDVVVPGGALEASITEITDNGDRIAKANDVGQALLERVKDLHIANRSKEYGGTSDNDWSLRQDTNEDDGGAIAQNIELYTIYYFDAIYIDGVEGNDGNYGASCSYPVRTWGRAKEIWESEMTKSRQARQDAVTKGDMTSDEIEAHIPMPEVIYICNTVKPNEPIWELPSPFYDDTRNAYVKTEVVSHIDHIAVQGEGNAAEPRHIAPETMIEVTDASLTIKNIYIRNMVDDTNSVTIKVGKGGTLNLEGDTTLNGTRKPSSGFAQKDLTLGSHIMVTEGGHLVIDTTGSIEYREQGVVAKGNKTGVEMKKGIIQQNNSYRADYYEAGRIDHKAGGGVALSNGAVFTMDGGTITKNQTYQNGAGVYLTDTGTTFIMNGGKISGNSLRVYRESSKNSSFMFSQGAGIFAGIGTNVKIGNGGTDEPKASISNNEAILARGTGIYANGSLSIDNAVISDNVGGGITNISNSINKGVGIYVGDYGTLKMEKGLVKGNHGASTQYGSTHGAGIYIESGSNTHTITQSKIIENETGYEYAVNDGNSAYATGGGIYLADGNTLTIADTTVSNNRAGRGGGIYAAGSNGHNINLTLKNTIIDGNKGIASTTSAYGDAGGVYFYGYGTLTLENGTKIINNIATQHSGGLFMGAPNRDTNFYMIATTSGAIEISGNKIINTESSCMGGGVRQSGGSWHAKNVLISDNGPNEEGSGILEGGGVYSSSSISYAYLSNMEFSNNRAWNGAALAISGSKYYIEDSKIEKNTATGEGGGIYLTTSSAEINSNTSTYMYLSERNGNFELKDNHAAYGGGISIATANTFMMDIAGPIQNSADVQGSNFYLSGYANIDILNGNFEQPVPESAEGVYNIYIDDKSTDTYNKYFDFSKVTVEKKEGANPDVVFLNTGASFLTVLKAPPSNNDKAFPIDLNEEAFQSGSVVLKPGATTSRSMWRPKQDLTTAESISKTYNPALTDATVNLNYYSGGKLPRRSHLGEFKDAVNPGRKNVIIVGDGVYLAGIGSGGKDTNDGSSPTTPVATFTKAKEVLEKRINEAAAADSNRPEEEREGFPPFIYICGQVDINTNESWVLDYEDALYTTKNEFYAIAERRNKAPVYEPQVRRFASFVQQPMIKIGNGSNPVSFTAGRLIIDGMADKVVLADQGSKSPVISASEKTQVFLTGGSTIRNNYYSALDIYGELTLNSESGTRNEQLYNNQAERTVRLFKSAKMWMQGDAKIVTDNTAEKVAGFSGGGIWIEGDDVSVFMEGNSAIIQKPGSTLLDGDLIHSLNKDIKNTTIKMTGDAKLVVGDKGADDKSAIKIFSDSKIDMSLRASIETMENASWRYGINMGDRSSLIMSDSANITYNGSCPTQTYGVYLNPSNTEWASVTMKNEAAIVLNSDNPEGSLAYQGIRINSGKSPTVKLLNNARITGNVDPPNSGSTYGIASYTARDAEIVLNEATDAPGDSASITGMQNGIYLTGNVSNSITMRQSAMVSGTYGIYMSGRNDETVTTNITMTDDSKIYKSNFGIYFQGYNEGPINIRMNKHAAIEQNAVGINEASVSGSGSINYGARRLDLRMAGESRISGNSSTGIQLVNTLSNWPEGRYQKITLDDNAMIGGGDNYYSSTDRKSGNQGAGIYANGPIEVTMNGNSKISRNGPGANGNTANSGINLTRTTNATYYRAGTAKITLNDSASICNNKGSGIYSATIGNSTTIFHNEVIIRLNGKAGESLTSPSIEGNTGAVYLGADTTLKLEGGAKVASDSNVNQVIDNYGYIELDGRSTVEGLIYMNNSTRPITMTHSATGSAPKYNLHLVEGFIGNVVVKPDGAGIENLTSPVSQREYFNNFSSDGMADGRPITERSPNLVLEGENNVYLSGTGSDDNTGNSPSTAVRTFRRARELLWGGNESERLLGGVEYKSGANIIICGSTVVVSSGDEDWSFGDDGFVTNLKSGDRWQPLVTRYKGFSGTLVGLYYGYYPYASKVTFKNITIDGGSENGIILASTDMQLLKVANGTTAVLGEGAVLQNNKAVTTSLSNFTALGVSVINSTLEINGGTIRNMVCELSPNLIIGGYQLASAVLVQGSASMPGNLIMKSGQIINNELNIPGARGTSNRIGTINITDNYSNMEMRGGLIENNKVVSNSTDPAAAGAIVNNSGSVTISGGFIRGNEGGYGSAVYYNGLVGSSKMVFSGGQISGNTTNIPGKQSVDKYSPIYVEQKGFELYGNGADIRDGIYLNQTLSAIKVSDSIYYAGRSYRIYLNFDRFEKGSVVVEPDGNKVTSVTSYLQYFDVRSNPLVLDQGRTSDPAGNVAGIKEEQCLILMKAVYLDSVGEDSNDNNNGLKPSQAVKSFETAKAVGKTGNGTSDHYVIYICNTASNIDGEGLWSLPKAAYMCRYTGFPVYESDGTETQELEKEYHGCLIKPGADLRFEDITIQGRRSIDSTEHNGDSLVNIPSGIGVIVESGAVFSYNYNNGNYIAEDGFSDSLASKGGAFQVAEGGSLTISGGEIKGNSATYGSGIYLHASKSNPSSLGRLYLTDSPVISDKVYLDGTANATAAYIQPTASYAPSLPLQISVGNDYNGRPLIEYIDVQTPGETELNHYSFDDAIKALYDIVNNNPNILELSLRTVIYLDGQNGSDESHDGTTPEMAFKTLKRTFEEIKKQNEQNDTKGVLVYVVGTLDIDGETDIQLMNIKVYDGDGTYHYEGYYMDSADTVNIQGQVYFKRYSQPQNYDAGNPVYEGYRNATLLDSLFNIEDGGILTLSGIYLDGHSVSCDSINPVLLAPAVQSLSPLITVKGGGILKCDRAEKGSNSVPTKTMFVNNINIKDKNAKEYENDPEYEVGLLNGTLIKEGSSAGIELLTKVIDEGTEKKEKRGTCYLEYAEFSNLALGSDVIGGTDVYSNGDLHFSRYTNFGGSVFLEGVGTKDANRSTSRYLTVDVQGTPVQNSFQVMIRDSYVGRDMVHYQFGIEATAIDAGYYLLEGRIKDYFCLSNRKGYPHILELQVPVGVYIDGTTAAGIDDPDDRFAGSNPKHPVKTLKRAFELLKTRGGNTIYVVNAIQVESDIQVTGMSYLGNDGNVTLGSTDKVTLGSTDKVNIVRYIKPDFAGNSEDTEAKDYDVEDYTGALLNVKDGAAARFSAGVYFDGHSEKKESPDLPKGALVTRTSEAKAPLITVEKGGNLNLLSDVALFDNNNTYADSDSSGQHGGAISNSGTTIVDGALFKNNMAAKGSVAYQDGTFTIKSAPENLADNPKAFYLTTENTGTPEQPVWGEDHVIQTAVAIPDSQIFDIDMDPEGAVAGRDVVRFTNNSAYNPNADAEHEHFHLGNTVPEELFLVEAGDDPDVLELQDWKVLQVNVPDAIYLVVTRSGSHSSSSKLMGVIDDPSAGTELFTTPEYTVKNKGSYDTKVSISGFENKTLEAGITADPMNLTTSAATATTAKDLYLAVKSFDGTTEIPLQPYAESPVAAAPVALGTLKKDMSGKFTFIGAVGSGFVEKYIDPDLVVEGSTKTQVQEYMDGSNDGQIKAKAKYLLKYKVEIDPSRRTP